MSLSLSNQSLIDIDCSDYRDASSNDINTLFAKDKLILVMYLNVSKMSSTAKICQRIYETKNMLDNIFNDETVITLVVPIESKDTYIDCLNTSKFTDTQLQEFYEHVEKIENIFKIKKS